MTGRKVHLGGLGPAAPTTREFAAFFAKWAGTSAVHRIVADPAQADLLLFLYGTDLRAPLAPEEKELLARRADDCFALDALDRPVGFLPGLYAAIPAPRFDPARFRTYCYPVENRQIEEAAIAAAAVPKAWFFSFLGGASSPLRRRIYGLRHGRADVVIEDTTAHQEWNPHQPAWAERKRRYAEVLAGSELCLCPRGAGVGSIRLFEAMQAGAVPVLIADDYVLPVGPDWESFLIRLPESTLRGGDLPRLLEPWRDRSRAMGLLARRAWEEWFAPAVWLDRIVENVEALRVARRVPEARARRKWPYWKLRRYLRERPAAALRAVRNRIRR